MRSGRRDARVDQQSNRLASLARARARPDDRDVRFERSDVPAFLPLWLAAGLGGFVVVVLVGVSIAFPLAVHQQYRGPLQSLPPAPRLQVSPGQDLKAYEAAKARELKTAPLPIDQAMKVTAAEGWGPPG
jgi:hypothetical protein